MSPVFQSILCGFLIFGIDILALAIGFKFYLYKKDLNEKTSAVVPLFAALVKFGALAFGVWYAVLYLKADILFFCLGAGLVLVICSAAVFIRRSR